MFRHLVILTLLSLLSGPVLAQQHDSFTGTVQYEVTFKGPIAEQISLNEPNNELQMHIHEGDYIVNLFGGRYPKTFMYINKMDREFSVDPGKKVVYKYNAHEDLNRKTHDSDPVAQKLNKQEVVNGDTCEVYGLKKEGSVMYFFVNDKYRVDTTYFKDKVQAKPNFLVKGLGGRIPLKTIKKQDGLTVTTTCTKIESREFDEAQFRIPKGYELKNRDYRP